MRNSLFILCGVMWFGAVLVGCGNTHVIRDASGTDSTTARSGPLGTTVVSDNDQYASDYQYCLKMQSGRSDAERQCRHVGNTDDPGPRCFMAWNGWMQYEICPGKPPVQSGPPPFVPVTTARPYYR